MSVPIPNGFKELEVGEIIQPTDMLYPRNANRFMNFKKKSCAPGKPYKDKATPLFPEVVVIRKVETPIVNVYCERLDKIPGGINLIYDLCRKHPIYNKYNIGDMSRRNFYLLTNWCGMTGANHVGTDNNSFESYRQKGAKKISYIELIKLLGGEVPRQKPMMIRLVMDILLRPVE